MAVDGGGQFGDALEYPTADLVFGAFESVHALWSVRISLMLPAGEIPAPGHPTENLALGPRR